MPPTTGAVLAVIPARGGSRRIPRKNIRILADRPMIAHTIAAAIGSGIFNDVVVSTDDPETAEIARAYGASTPFLRDAAIADDHTPVSTVVLDAVVRLDPDGDRYGAIAQLMPNCPLRTDVDVRESYRAFQASGHESQISVVRYGWFNPWWAMRRGNDGGLEAVFPEAMARRSQDLDELYCPTGAIWWIRSETLRREGTFHTARRAGWEIAWDHGIDIDDAQDLDMASRLLALQDQDQ